MRLIRNSLAVYCQRPRYVAVAVDTQSACYRRTRLCQRQRVVRRATKVHADIVSEQQVARRDVVFGHAR